MTRLEDRQTLAREIEQARTGGARLAEVCAMRRHCRSLNHPYGRYTTRR